ncbi:MAG: tRNA 4-thiouridine(8) synthase ThiI, partial [Clostridiaceae bacterium]|nr:tRNA 4-thiouridine(8) synthase ThiI [Clostridiaceae bacterium]
MEKVILIRYEEIFLKGLNKKTFENQLIRNIKERLASLGEFSVTRSQSRIYVESSDQKFDLDEAMIKLQKIFGIASISPVVKVPSDYETIKEKTLETVENLLKKYHYKSFKVEAKRGDKKFPLNSPQICADLGGHILKNFSTLKVDVHNPDFIFYVEVRESTYLYSEI